MKIHIHFSVPFVNCDWRNWHTLVKKAGAFTKNSNWYLKIFYCKGVLFEFQIEGRAAFLNDPHGIVMRFALFGLVIDFKTGLWYSTADPESWAQPLKAQPNA